MKHLGLWLAVFSALVLAGACSSDDPPRVGLAEGCILNTDCESPLVCAFRKCHVACTSSRDCKVGQRCMVSDRPFHVCQLDEEITCEYSSQCPIGQVCGVDQQCRDQCTSASDCVGGQDCVGGACAERRELSEGGVLPPPATDGGRDASRGQSCLYTSDCPAPLICRYQECSRECLTALDCVAGSTCVNSRCVTSQGKLVGADGGVITDATGKVTLTIPPGALRTPVAVTIGALKVWPEGALGPVFQIEPTGLQFETGATLTYRYADGDIGAVPPSELRLSNAVKSTWFPLPSTLDLAQKTITATLAHLSVYGICGNLKQPIADAGVDAPRDAAPDGPTGCAAVACSGSVADNCCPPSCTATSDVDCAGCGNGHLDTGEVCDPIGSCPTSCPQMGCQLFSLVNAGTCQALCAAMGTKSACANGDGCCPAGCTTKNDSDCMASCGNGVVEAGELCDGNCPAACAPVGCQTKTLVGDPAACNAHCVDSTVVTACVADDACCPSTCNMTSDADCVPRCGNGIVENGEVCDGNCPTTCAAQGCQLRVPQGDRAMCNVTCVDDALQTACINGDSCCPAGCTSLNDNDCKPACGNSVVETGETCDPPSACATAQTACVNDANTVVAASGSAMGCTFVCKRTARTCGPSDTFCPTNVACGPTSDVDCPGCGNGRIETARGETCDPVSTCNTQQSACVSDANNVRTSSGSAAACTYRCTTATRTCGPSDGFCPTGCGPTQDVDCPGCGNGRIETARGETCDVAPAAVVCTGINCDDGNSCTTDTQSGSVAACTLACGHTTVTACIRGDGCCPAGCNANNDDDCGAVCGNGVREGGETCETKAPATPICSSISCNDNDNCTTDKSTGSATTCNVACQHAAVTACTATSDGCCPGGGRGTCNANNDVDCAPLCGNGVLEGKEICEVSPAKTVCPGSCDDGDACTTDKSTGTAATCDLVCSHAAITACDARTADGCCPKGCNATTDLDCPAVCGNGVVEPGETCDTQSTTRAGVCPSSCAQNGCTLRGLIGSMCTVQCVDQGNQTACVDSDGCCPSGCSDYNDTDCKTTNDQCANAAGVITATDITKNDPTYGIDHPFSLLQATQDVAGACTTATPAAEVFFVFKLDVPSIVYLDVYDPASETSGTAVPVALELYSDTCPAATGTKSLACDSGANGQRNCNTKWTWPRVLGTNVAAGTYYVAARQNGTAGRYKLRFQRIPLACLTKDANGGQMPALTAASTLGVTCTANQNLYAPSCTSQDGIEDTYFMAKCPKVGLNLDTCSASDTSATILQLNEASIDLVNGRCVPRSGQATGCNNKDATCKASTLASRVTDVFGAQRGLLTVSVDNGTNPCATRGAGNYGLNFSQVSH